MLFLFSLLFSIAFLILAIVKFKIHPFFALLLTSILFGFVSGMSPSLIIESINDGFGGILGKIGLIILFGVVIGTILEKSGGALVIATRILKAIGDKSIHLAMLVTGYILSIPIFADSALIMMNPLNKVLSKKANVSYAGTTAALGVGLMAAHVMVPPTPGPIAAAGILGANLGSVILWGLLVSGIALIPCYFYATKIASRIQIPINVEPIENPERLPKLWISLLAIVIPLFLILLKSVFEYPELEIRPSFFKTLVMFVGSPVIALLIGVIIALILPEKLDEKIFGSSSWISESLKIAAPIILITGAGGIFGKILQNSNLSETISSSFVDMNIGLFLPFLLAACLKTAQGSSTVAIVTSASIVAPLMTTLGLDSPFMGVMTVLAIGAGSAVASHVNDSFFWVLTQLTGMKVKEGYQVLTASTFIFGVTAMIIIYLLTVII